MAASATSTGLRVSRPSLLISGQEDSGLAQALLQLIICESVHGLYHGELKFGNWGPSHNAIDFLYFDRKKLDFGKTVQVKVDDNKLFDGRISALEGRFNEGSPPEIAVLVEDRFQDLRMTQRTRSFEEVSDADVMRRIAQDHGLQPQVDADGPTHHVLQQVNQSDLSFLRERARFLDAEIWLDNQTLYCKSRSKRNDGTVKLSYGGELREVTVTADLAEQQSSVTVVGWDVAGKQQIKYEASDQVLGAELNGGTSGASVLNSAFGQRKKVLSHTLPLTTTEAQTEAESVMKMTSRRFLVARGMAQGNAKLNVGSYVDMAGLGPLFSGKYYLSYVKHIFDGKQGYLTEFTAERPGLGTP
jgi:phage protein D